MTRKAVLLFFLVALVAASTVWPGNETAHFAWESLPGFYAFYGFLVAWLLGGVAKAFLARWLQRPREEGESHA
ncbi:MAG: hypothetical protein KatS3mg076_1749 [Candidatus Binatia bacterium]|nr:MAG: hypothetical protein KatS3mg076_1749 [Candidatus Binatia bacterium]